MGSGPPKLGTSSAHPDDFISEIRALRIRGLGDKDMEEILCDVLAEYEVKDWERLLTAAPSTILTIGECLFVALSNGIGQTAQKKDKSMYWPFFSHMMRLS